MPSLINVNVPVHGIPTTLSVRRNFEVIKAEIEELQESSMTAFPLPLRIQDGGTGRATAGAALENLGGAPLDSPEFTGVVRGPHPPSMANDDQLATTNFVKSQNYLINNQNISVTGDVTGNGATAITARVVALQTRPVANTAPQFNQVMTWTGAQWSPQTPAESGVTQIIAGPGLTGGTITGQGTISLEMPISVSRGGTGATSAAGALTSLGAAALTYVDNQVADLQAQLSGALGGTVPEAPGATEVYGRIGGASPSWQPVLRATGGALTGPLLLAGDPTINAHAVNKGYFDTQVNSLIGDINTALTGYLELGGGTIAGSLTINNDLTCVGTGTFHGNLDVQAGPAAALRINGGVGVPFSFQGSGGNLTVTGPVAGRINVQTPLTVNNDLTVTTTSADTSSLTLAATGTNSYALTTQGRSLFTGTIISNVGTGGGSQWVLYQGPIGGANERINVANDGGMTLSRPDSTNALTINNTGSASGVYVNNDNNNVTKGISIRNTSNQSAARCFDIDNRGAAPYMWFHNDATSHFYVAANGATTIGGSLETIGSTIARQLVTAFQGLSVCREFAVFDYAGGNSVLYIAPDDLTLLANCRFEVNAAGSIFTGTIAGATTLTLAATGSNGTVLRLRNGSKDHFVIAADGSVTMSTEFRIAMRNALGVT